MKTLFLSQGLWNTVQNGYTQLHGNDNAQGAPTATAMAEFEENQRKYDKALLCIEQGVEKAIFPRIKNATTSKEAWDALKTDFEISDN